MDLIFEGVSPLDTSFSSDMDNTREWSIGELAILSNERSFTTSDTGAAMLRKGLRATMPEWLYTSVPPRFVNHSVPLCLNSCTHSQAAV